MTTIRTLAIAALMGCTVAMPAMASSQDNVDEKCGAFAEMAEGIAKLHQHGTSLTKALSIIDTVFPGNQGVFREVVINIYRRPRHYGEEAQQREVEDVRDQAHLECLDLFVQSPEPSAEPAPPKLEL